MAEVTEEQIREYVQMQATIDALQAKLDVVELSRRANDGTCHVHCPTGKMELTSSLPK